MLVVCTLCVVSQLVTCQSGFLYVKNVPQHNLKIRLKVLLFVPNWCVPHLLCIVLLLPSLRLVCTYANRPKALRIQTPLSTEELLQQYCKWKSGQFYVTTSRAFQGPPKTSLCITTCQSLMAENSPQGSQSVTCSRAGPTSPKTPTAISWCMHASAKPKESPIWLLAKATSAGWW